MKKQMIELLIWLVLSCFVSCFGQESSSVYEIHYSIAPQHYSQLTSPYVIVRDSDEKCAIFSLRKECFISDFVYDDVEIIGHGYFMTDIKDKLPSGMCLTDSLGNDLTKRGEYNNFFFASDLIITGYGRECQCYYNIKSGQFVDICQINQNYLLSMDGYDYSNCCSFYDWDTRKCGLIDADNRIVVEPNYRDIRTPVDGLIAACDEVTGKWGIINSKGKSLIPFEYNDVYISSVDCFTFQDLKGKWGVCDMNNRCIIEPIYNSAVLFKDGTAIVEKGEKKGLIDVQGKLIVPIKFSDIIYLGSGFFMCKDSDSHISMFNSNGIRLFEDVSLTEEEKGDLRQENGYIAINYISDKKNDIAYYDSSGNSYVSNKYKKIERFNNGFARVLSNNNKWGIIDTNFHEVVPCRYDWIYRYLPDERILVYGKQGNNYSTLFISFIR